MIMLLPGDVCYNLCLSFRRIDVVGDNNKNGEG